LLALKADLDEALARSAAGPAEPHSGTVREEEVQKERRESEPQPKTATPPAAVTKPSAVPVAKTATSAKGKPGFQTKPALAAAEPPGTSRLSRPGPQATVSPAPEPMDADNCLEAIWEQLIAAPPSRGRSMSTVALQDTKVLLSSWEVAAFVAEGGQDAEDLRRAVVARALVGLGVDARKRSGDDRPLSEALRLARTEVSYFQGRVEQAKRGKHTEAAVNLGISAKRLLSIIEEAEKLQP
jgi:hypothetical protein